MQQDKPNFAQRLESMASLDDIRAVAPGSSTTGSVPQPADNLGAESSIVSTEALAFEKAGWTFVKSAPDNPAVGHGVVIDGDGHMKILSDALNVKFDPALSQNEVKDILASHDLSIRRNMGFAPNLFVVSGQGGDALSKAKSLNTLDGVVYAEPVMIEPIEGR